MDTKNSGVQMTHIWERWHSAVKTRDLEALMSIYAEDAVLETPAILAVYKDQEEGILRGRKQIEVFFGTSLTRAQAAHSSDFGLWWRTGQYYSDGALLMWEYPRTTPHGDQLDLVESMDIEEGLISYHRVYWGWKGFKALAAAIGR
jgi:steroid delta-isomerase